MIVYTELLTLYRQRLLFWLVGVGMIVVLPAAGVALVQLLGKGGPGSYLLTGVFAGFGSIAAMVIAMIIGATAGARDYASGMMREYALTGVPLWKVHASQLLAALVMVSGLLIAGALLMLAVTVAGSAVDAQELSSGVAHASAGEVVRVVIASVLFVVMLVLGSHAVGSIVRSRGIAIAIIAGYLLIADGIIGLVVGDEVTFRGAMYTTLEALLDPQAYDENVRAIVAAVAWLALLVIAPLLRLYRSEL